MSEKIQPSQSAAATAIAIAWEIVSTTTSDKTETPTPKEPKTAAQKGAARAKRVNELALQILSGIPLVPS